MFDFGIKNGAIRKLIGAGGGGFFYFIQKIKKD